MTDDEIPPIEPLWVALAMVTWALALALAPSVRERFVGALERLCDDLEARRHVVAIDTLPSDVAPLWAANAVAATWVRSLIAELREAQK